MGGTESTAVAPDPGGGEGPGSHGRTGIGKDHVGGRGGNERTKSGDGHAKALEVRVGENMACDGWSFAKKDVKKSYRKVAI